MKKSLYIIVNRLRAKLWFRPLLLCILAILLALVAHLADGLEFFEDVPDISIDSLSSLLDTISASMLVIAIFSVASMLSAFSAASSTATPRSFSIVVKDDVSQNALSTFIGAFIFSIVGTIALDNGYYGQSGRFILFLFTLIFFAVVILTFLRWVDRISRLGRLEHTIDQVEKVAGRSLCRHIVAPCMDAHPADEELEGALAVLSHQTGYVQHFNLEALQEFAETSDLQIRMHCRPGSFVHRNTTLASYRSDGKVNPAKVEEHIGRSVHIGDTRRFEEDPRFGFITLTEIASRALSPGINDPGTAIQILGSHERLFFKWQEVKTKVEDSPRYDRIYIPSISMKDFFDDAFRPIARDGKGTIEVMLRLQKTLAALATIPNKELQELARSQSRRVLQQAEEAIGNKKDLEELRERAGFGV